MFLKILLNYILGYVNIKVEGFFIERFINICISKKILLWNMKREKSTILYANIGIQDYKKLKNIAKKTKTRISIQSKKGMPFLLHRYRKRKIFVGLLAIIFIALFMMSKFIWNIEVKGNTRISKIEILEELSKNGLKIGTYKEKINANSVINKIRLDREDIAWIGIDIEGTNAIVEIKETSKAPEIINENEYCNIISNKEGMITKINVQNGTAVVKEGDIVKEGDTLINGWLEGKYTGIRYVHAKADIEAKIWYSKKEKVFLKQQIQVPTGATEEKYTLNINNFKINFSKKLSKFKIYDTIETENKIKLFSDFYLPISVIKTTNKEVEEIQKTYETEEAKNIGIEQLQQELDDEIVDKTKIVNKVINTYEVENGVDIYVTYEVLENIGTNEKIVF